MARERHQEPMRTRRIISKLKPEAQEKRGGQAAFGFCLNLIGRKSGASLGGPIGQRSNAKSKQFWITFNAQLKIALSVPKAILPKALPKNAF